MKVKVKNKARIVFLIVFAIFFCLSAVAFTYGKTKKAALANEEKQEVIVLDKPEDFYIDGSTINGLSALAFKKLGVNVASDDMQYNERETFNKSINVPFSIKIPELSSGGTNIKFINDQAFIDCTTLSGLNLIENIIVGEQAFRNCASITNLTVPIGVNVRVAGFENCNIEILTFYGNTADDDSFAGNNIKELYILSDNITFDADYSSTFGTASPRVIVAPASIFTESNGEYFVFPEGSLDYLESVTITSGEVTSETFKNAPNLKDVTLTDGVTSVDPNAFAKNPNITDITYTGDNEKVFEEIKNSIPETSDVKVVKPSTVTPVVAEGNLYAGESLPQISLSEGDTSGTIEWIETTLAEGTHEYNWKFTPADSDYEEKTGTISLTATKKPEPIPEQPKPENPKPENPTPENPTPENPTPDNPTPDNPTPENPTPDQPTQEVKSEFPVWAIWLIGGIAITVVIVSAICVVAVASRNRRQSAGDNDGFNEPYYPRKNSNLPKTR